MANRAATHTNTHEMRGGVRARQRSNGGFSCRTNASADEYKSWDLGQTRLCRVTTSIGHVRTRLGEIMLS